MTWTDTAKEKQPGVSKTCQAKPRDQVSEFTGSVAWPQMPAAEGVLTRESPCLPRGTIVMRSTASRCEEMPASRHFFLKIVASSPLPASYAVKRCMMCMRFGKPGLFTPCGNLGHQLLSGAADEAFVEPRSVMRILQACAMS